MVKKFALIAVAAATLAAAGCTTEDRYTAGGAGIGGLGGAAIGAGITGDTRGALIGGALGAGAGAIFGNQIAPDDARLRGRYQQNPEYCLYDDGNVYRCPGY